MNDMERDFATLLDANHVKWEYEPHFYFLKGSSKKHGYCPDFCLSEYNVYIEIYSAEEEIEDDELSIKDKIDARRRHLKRKSEYRRFKRLRIRLLSRYSGKATVLIHPGNWTTDWTEIERLIQRAQIAALVQRFAQIISPQPSDWEL